MARALRQVRFALLIILAVSLPLKGWATVFNPTSFTLANGLQVVVVPNHLAPAVTQMVWYKVGSADEKAGKTGLAHYLEHLMFRGTTETPAGQFSAAIAARGGQENAFTAYDYTAYFETVSVENLPLIMRLEADRMHNLNIKPETATPELSVVLSERQQRTDNSPEGRFNEKLRGILMPQHPYGVPVIGWKKEIQSLTPTDATRFYQKNYAPNNAVVVISGDVMPDDVMRLAAAIYGNVPKGHIATRPVLDPSPEPKRHNLTMEDAGVEQPQFVWHAVVPSYSTQKNDEAYAYEVLSEVLDGGEVGFLYRNLVVGQGVATGSGAQYDPDARGDAIFSIGLTPKSTRTAKKLDKILHDELADLAQKGIDPVKVDEAKKRLQRSAVFARDNLMMPGYAFGMALTTGHSVADVEAWPDRIQSVTVEQVNAALHGLLETPRYVSGILLPDPTASPAAREAARPSLSHDMGIR